jgi:predicted GNAT family N-acyltransferase
VAFADYMKAKIEQREAVMAIDKNEKKCLGIVAFSRNHNRITFFGISHNQDYYLVGEILMSYALNQLNSHHEITINVIKSTAHYIEKEREFIKKFGFICIGSEFENGVPVDKMMKQSS